MKAHEIMTKNPECLTRDDTVRRAAELMREHDVGLIPIVDDRTGMRLSGVITDRDIAIRHVAEGHEGECRIGDEMSSDSLRTVGPDDDTETVMRAMRDAKVRRIPVVEDGNRLVGIIAQADIATEKVDAREVEKTVEEISRPGRSRR